MTRLVRALIDQNDTCPLGRSVKLGKKTLQWFQSSGLGITTGSDRFEPQKSNEVPEFPTFFPSFSCLWAAFRSGAWAVLEPRGGGRERVVASQELSQQIKEQEQKHHRVSVVAGTSNQWLTN